jgi:hypothetical protein
VFLADQPLRQHVDLFAEGRRRKALAPDFLVQVSTRSTRRYSGVQRAVGLQRRVSVAASSHSCATSVQALRKGPEMRPVDGAACRHGVAAKTQQHAGVALGHQVQRIAQVEAGNRSPRALEFVFLARRLAGGKHEGRAVQLVLDARGHDADHAFMKVGVEHADGGGRLVAFSNSDSAICIACSRMSPSISRRSRLMPSSVRASSSARFGSSVSRHSMPSVMSLRRPAALMRGPSAKPKSKVVATAALRPAAVNRLDRPAGIAPARTRFRPWATRRRLLASSRTTSATVPSATSGSRVSSLGWSAA